MRIKPPVFRLAAELMFPHEHDSKVHEFTCNAITAACRISNEPIDAYYYAYSLFLGQEPTIALFCKVEGVHLLSDSPEIMEHRILTLLLCAEFWRNRSLPK